MCCATIPRSKRARSSAPSTAWSRGAGWSRRSRRGGRNSATPRPGGASRDPRSRPLPAEHQLLAIISQRPLTLDDDPAGGRDTELTVSGTRRLGLAPLPPSEETAGRAQPLFSVRAIVPYVQAFPSNGPLRLPETVAGDSAPDTV